MKRVIFLVACLAVTTLIGCGTLLNSTATLSNSTQATQTLIDPSTSTVNYIGTGLSGVAEDSPHWNILKIDTTDTPYSYKMSNGSNEMNVKFSDRKTITYK